MDLITLLKFFGAAEVERLLSNAFHKHVTSAGYKALGAHFTDGAKGCADGDPDEVAHAVTAILFSAH